MYQVFGHGIAFGTRLEARGPWPGAVSAVPGGQPWIRPRPSSLFVVSVVAAEQVMDRSAVNLPVHAADTLGDAHGPLVDAARYVRDQHFIMQGVA